MKDIPDAHDDDIHARRTRGGGLIFIYGDGSRDRGGAGVYETDKEEWGITSVDPLTGKLPYHYGPYASREAAERAYEEIKAWNRQKGWTDCGVRGRTDARF